MGFVVGVVLFVVVIGMLDARFPWPRPRPGDRRR
jgi:hypothetical protein